MFKMIRITVTIQAVHLTQTRLVKFPISARLLVNMTSGIMANGNAILRKTCDIVSRSSPAAQEGVFLVGLVEVGQRLVAAHVQGADNHPLAPHGSQNLPVGVELFLLPRLGGAV